MTRILFAVPDGCHRCGSSDVIRGDTAEGGRLVCRDCIRYIGSVVAEPLSHAPAVVERLKDLRTIRGREA